MNGQKYNHPEAFCLMRYRDVVTGEVEVLWNSRDGVTPFVITSRAGNSAKHVDWKLDRQVPNHVPKVGDRIFVDMTMENALPEYRGFVDRMLAEPKSGFRELAEEKGLDADGLARFMIEQDIKQHGESPPHVIEVTEEVQKKFQPKPDPRPMTDRWTCEWCGSVHDPASTCPTGAR